MFLWGGGGTVDVIFPLRVRLSFSIRRRFRVWKLIGSGESLDVPGRCVRLK